jgi:hypothetical protein
MISVERHADCGTHVRGNVWLKTFQQPHHI